jgi:hypothetical protein
VQLNHALVDEIAVHLGSATEDLENQYWHQQYELIQANRALRQVAKQCKIRFTDLAVFPTLFQSLATTDEERREEFEQRRKLEQLSPEIGAASERCTAIAKIVSELEFELVGKMAAEGLDIDTIAKRIGVPSEAVTRQCSPSICNP